ncbi:MAG: S24 family peptidase [Rickettsiales bacterium]|nr:S24 family peptidase [Rickettsiales bacterium]
MKKASTEAVKKQRGGARPNAGRKKGDGPHGESTRPLRIPESLFDDVINFIKNKGFKVPFFDTNIPAGVPVEIQNEVDEYINFNDMLIKDRESTYVLTAKGDSMTEVGIFDGSKLVVDTVTPAKSGDIVVAIIDGEATVKSLRKTGDALQLIPHSKNPKYNVINIPKKESSKIWGVVNYIINKG